MISGLKFAGVFALGMGIFGTMLMPSVAGDYHGPNGNFIHHGMHGGNSGNHRDDRGRGPDVAHYATASGGLDTGNRSGFRHHRDDWHDRNRFVPNHPRRLQQLASGNFYTQQGSGITMQLSGRPHYTVVGNDAGASDSFSTAAGTYSVGYGDYPGDRAATPPLAPMAKIINIATMADPCAYESGVCVIRP